MLVVRHIVAFVFGDMMSTPWMPPYAYSPGFALSQSRCLREPGCDEPINDYTHSNYEGEAEVMKASGKGARPPGQQPASDETDEALSALLQRKMELASELEQNRQHVCHAAHVGLL
jgi:hypothetical protein